MKVICPKCQYENQADSMRVVCARCATIIDVKTDQTSGLDLNGRRSTSQLPFAARESGSQAPAPPPRDVYATRLGDEFDDVLDIPRPNPSSYQTNYDPNSVFDDVFSTSGYESTSSFEYPGSEKRSPTAPIDDFSGGRQRQRQTQDYAGNVEPEFMGWPVLPENSLEDDEPAASGPGKGGLVARIILGAVVFGALVIGAYYILGDLISKRRDQADNLVAAGSPAAVKGQQPAAAESKPQAPARSEAAASNPPAPVVNPRPQSEAKPVDIPPIAGKGGHSESPKPVAPVTPAVQAPPPAPRGGGLTIQVASFNDQAQAADRASKLKSLGVDARVVKADIPGKGTWYRVQIGGFASREEASGYGNQLRARGAVQDFIVTPVK